MTKMWNDANNLFMPGNDRLLAQSKYHRRKFQEAKAAKEEKEKEK